MGFRIKDFNAEVEDVSGRTVTAVWSSTSMKDLDGDVIVDTAFNKTISESSYKGSNLIVSITDHKFDTDHLLGKPKELYVQNQKLYAVTDIIDNTFGNDKLKLYQAGIIGQHSIGFVVPKGKQEQKGDYNEIREVKLYEGSAVLRGANPETPTISVKSLTIEQAIDKSSNLFNSIRRMAKLLKNGTLTDDAFVLLEIALVQKQTELDEIIEAFFSKSLSTDPNNISQPNTPATEQAKQITIWTACQMINN